MFIIFHPFGLIGMLVIICGFVVVLAQDFKLHSLEFLAFTMWGPVVGAALFAISSGNDQVWKECAITIFVCVGIALWAADAKRKLIGKRWHAKFKVCPSCAEVVNKPAAVCKFCHHHFTSAAT
jgi:hypothetical protein